MIIESKNFHMILGDGDMLCLGQVQTNYKEGEYPKLVIGEEFLKEVANFAVKLAEKNLVAEKRIKEAMETAKKYYCNPPKYKRIKGKKGIVAYELINN